jgi:hypothetical protein
MSKKDMTVIPQIVAKPKAEQDWKGLSIVLALGWIPILLLILVVAIVKG